MLRTPHLFFVQCGSAAPCLAYFRAGFFYQRVGEQAEWHYEQQGPHPIEGVGGVEIQARQEVPGVVSQYDDQGKVPYIEAIGSQAYPAQEPLLKWAFQCGGA